MGELSVLQKEILISLGLLLGMLGALEIGFRFGRRAAANRDGPGVTSQIGAIQGAALGLVGLLLAFSFAGASSRFMDRQTLVTREANALGTAWLRAGLLDEPQRAQLRDALRDYTRERIVLFGTYDVEEGRRVSAGLESLHAVMWSAAEAGVRGKPALAVAVLAPVNEIIDLHTERNVASQRHLPGLVLGVLIGCALVGVCTIGFGCGVAGKRHMLLAGSLTLLIAAALWTTIDLDYPRVGLVRINDDPLRALRFEAPSPL